MSFFSERLMGVSREWARAGTVDSDRVTDHRAKNNKHTWNKKQRQVKRKKTKNAARENGKPVWQCSGSSRGPRSRNVVQKRKRRAFRLTGEVRGVTKNPRVPPLHTWNSRSAEMPHCPNPSPEHSLHCQILEPVIQYGVTSYLVQINSSMSKLFVRMV